jgi:hypothetical protein
MCLYQFHAVKLKTVVKVTVAVTEGPTDMCFQQKGREIVLSVGEGIFGARSYKPITSMF